MSTDASGAALEPRDAHDHFVRFYEDEALLLAEVAGFAERALSRGASAVVIATGAHLAELERALPAGGPGRLVLLDAAETLECFMVDGWPDEQCFYQSVGAVMAEACADGRPHAFGEMVALLCAQGHYEAALRLERLWNELAQRLHFSLFCAYPWRLFPRAELAEVFHRVCAEHDHACSHTHAKLARVPKPTALNLLKLEQKALALESEVARRKHAEHTLERQEQEFADFVENAAEGLHRVGADGTILWANKAELQMLGYRWEEYVGRQIADFHVDRSVIKNILARLKAGETLYDQPARLRCKDGSVKHVVIHSNASFENGELRYTRCFTRDATERRERDEALAQRDQVLLNLPEAAALLAGPEYRLELANRRCRELAGRSDLEGKPLLEAIPGLAGSELEQLLRRAWDTREPVCSDHLRVLFGAADERYFKVSIEPLVLAGGQPRAMILVAVDVTEQVRARHELERAHAERESLLAELTAASHAKDEFLAMLGHELRNPLAPIVAALQLMRMRGESAGAREREIIQRQVEHLVRLVDDLLDVSRVTRGKIELRFQRVDIAQPLAKAVEMASQLLEARRHRLELDVEPGLSWEGDPVRLAQVVANLLTNAARYTDPGGRVVLRAGRDAGGWLRIGVADNGIGLDPGMLDQVFGLFVQAKRGMDRSEGGLGIGLALVKNIVELHGGSVQARSEGRGKGSEFIVRLPLRAQPRVGWAHRAHADQHGEQACEVGREALGAPDRSRPAPVPGRRACRIMVVDDNIDAAQMLGHLFEAHGHLVEVFHGAARALAAAQRFLPDVAVLDIGLPGMDGYQLAARLRGLLGAHPCRLIALTGYGQENDRQRSREAGFEEHLVKPISIEHVERIAAMGAQAS